MVIFEGNIVESVAARIHSNDGDGPLSVRVRSALGELLEADFYAVNTNSSRWDFAVSMQHLHKKLGITLTDLRWLVKRGYIEHACEITTEGADGREFRCTGNLTFHKRTCVVLTDSGVAKALSLVSKVLAWEEPIILSPAELAVVRKPIPRWNQETRELSFQGVLVKRFKWQAANQEIILNAFQEDNWPTVIDDPLPPKPELDSKGRLQDTIKALNRNQNHAAIRFHGNGTADGVRWEPILRAEAGSPR